MEELEEEVVYVEEEGSLEEEAVEAEEPAEEKTPEEEITTEEDDVWGEKEEPEERGDKKFSPGSLEISEVRQQSFRG